MLFTTETSSRTVRKINFGHTGCFLIYIALTIKVLPLFLYLQTQCLALLSILPLCYSETMTEKHTQQLPLFSAIIHPTHILPLSTALSLPPPLAWLYKQHSTLLLSRGKCMLHHGSTICMHSHKSIRS